MIRTERLVIQAPKPRPLDPLLDKGWQKFKSVIVSRIKRAKPESDLKAKLSQKFKVTEKKK